MENKNDERKCEREACHDDDKLTGAAYGEAVASAAIDAMRAEDGTVTAAKAFIRKCAEEDVLPIDVVTRVAKHFGIRLSGDVPEGEERANLYFLLSEVVRQVVLDEFDTDMSGATKIHTMRYAFTW